MGVTVVVALVPKTVSGSATTAKASVAAANFVDVDNLTNAGQIVCPRCNTSTFTRGVVQLDSSVSYRCDDCGRSAKQTGWAVSTADDDKPSPKQMRMQRGE